MLHLDDHWVWDSWIADDGDHFHLFFLKAPRSLGDPSLRHTAAVIGHATSHDLHDWDIIADALHPSSSGWDDLALWTGSVINGSDGVWRLFYTAINSAGRGVHDQRIGLAESDDLISWHRVGDRPIVEPDPRWYRTLDGGVGPSETWRDPFVFADPDGDGWHMLITARAARGTRNDDGVLAHARSHDLRDWELGPPLCAPGAGFGQLEVAQVRVVGGRPVLAFTCHPDEQTEQRVTASGRFCTWSISAESVLGPWDIDHAVPLRSEPHLFAAPLVATRTGGWAMLGFRNREAESVWSFDIIDPVPVELVGRGLA